MKYLVKFGGQFNIDGVKFEDTFEKVYRMKRKSRFHSVAVVDMPEVSTETKGSWNASKNATTNFFNMKSPQYPIGTMLWGDTSGGANPYLIAIPFGETSGMTWDLAMELMENWDWRTIQAKAKT